MIARAKAAGEGLQVGDVITAVDGTPTPDMDKVNELKQDKKAGDKLTLSVYRMFDRQDAQCHHHADRFARP